VAENEAGPRQMTVVLAGGEVSGHMPYLTGKPTGTGVDPR